MRTPIHVFNSKMLIIIAG